MSDLKKGGPLRSTGTTYAPFDRSLPAYGINCIALPALGGQNTVDDDFVKKVARTITLIFGSGGSIDSTLQQSTLESMLSWKCAQCIGYGTMGDYSPPLNDSNYSGWDNTRDTNANVDFIWQLSSGTYKDQITEVLEHALHTITVYGLQYSFPTKMNQTNQTSDIYLAMQQAITTNGSDGNPIFDTSGYSGSMSDPDYRALLMREYYYLLVYAEWGFITNFVEGGSLAPEWNDSAINSAGVQSYNPLGHQLYLDTAAKTITAPSTSTLTTMYDGGSSGYTNDYEIVRSTNVDFSGPVTVK